MSPERTTADTRASFDAARALDASEVVTAIKPFAAAAWLLWTHGHAVLGLPHKEKGPPPTGFTGRYANQAGVDEILQWIASPDIGNVGVRLPIDVVGIDVDDYDGKPGAESLADLEARAGEPLPSTLLVTSRSDGVSGIRFFRLPRDIDATEFKPPAGIDVIRYGHRYAVAPPSVHPKLGTVYRAVDERTGAVHEVGLPSFDDLPFLPAGWVAVLLEGPRVVAATPERSMVQLPLPHSRNDSCECVARGMADTLREMRNGSSRHDTMVRSVAQMLRLAEMRHSGADRALIEIRSAFVASVVGDATRSLEEAAGEWDRAIVGGNTLVGRTPTSPADYCGGVCGRGGGDDGLYELAGVVRRPPDERDSTAEVGPTVNDASGQEARFWNSRPGLLHLHTFARARRVSPWALLGVTLARVVTAVPPYIVLPSLVGSVASLNLFVALVGPSGSGKSAGISAAADALDVGSFTMAHVGSGEGVAHLYAHREKVDGAMVVVRHETAVLFVVPEVDSLTALGNRQGATLMPELRKAWSGERLGFGYADPTKNLPIAANTYRLALILGVQPGRAGKLFDDSDGGTPQRFLFLPTLDPLAPATPPACPEPASWILPAPWQGDGRGLAPMTLPQSVSMLIDAARYASLTGQGDGLDGHALLARLKVAAALCLYDARSVMSEEDWDLAGIVMAVSDRCRAGVVAELADAGKRINTAKALAERDRAVAVADGLDDRVTKRLAAGILRRLRGVPGDGWVTSGRLRRDVASRDRTHVADALAALVSAGQVEVKDEGQVASYRATDRK